MSLQRKPRVGDRIGFGEFSGQGNGNVATVCEASTANFTVMRVDGNLCWIHEDGKPDEPRYASPFIWQFTEGLNRLVKIFDA